MILLDTDHLTVLLDRESSRYAALKVRLQASDDQAFATPIICVEEQLRGWLAKIHRARAVLKQVLAYERLAKLLAFFHDLRIIRFDERAANEFNHLRKQRIRIGTMDLKIASVARVHDVLLLSANLSDFRQVPGLQLANWLA